MTIESASTNNSRSFLLNLSSGRVIRFYLTISIPVILVLIGVRLAMSEAFLRFEYRRSDFPIDVYGFIMEDRLQYASYTLDYLINNEDIGYLKRLTLPDRSPLYNTSELRHMEDVQTVTRIAFITLMIFTLVTALLLWQTPRTSENNHHIYTGFMQGSLLTLGVIIALVMLAVTAWDIFFTGFHQIFFENGTWRFYYSDTLIRLFPERFWFDAAIFVGGFSGIISLLIIMIILLSGSLSSQSITPR